jgi:beta-galactosidase
VREMLASCNSRVLLKGMIAAALMLVPGWSIAQTAAPDTTVLLNGTWQFAFAPDIATADRLADFYLSNYNTKQFVPIRVPSNWAMQGFEPPHYKPFREEASQGFYLDRFNVPATWQDKRVLLHFGGVWSSAEVWLNGKPLGRHDSGYTSFAYDATAALNVGGDNVLAVRVRQTTHDFRFDTNDDWAMGGIYRDVSLETMPKTRWIDRVDAQTVFDDQFRDADLKVRVMVEDTHTRRDEIKPYELLLTLLGIDGESIQSAKIAIPGHPDTGRDVGITLHVQGPQHWTAETPALYRLRVDLLEGGQVAHTRTLQVGFRQISTANGIFRINGQAVKLRGVDRHDEYPDVGRATTPANWLQDLTLMKAANINFIRTSHYPPASGFLDLCDRMGMYVDDEVPMGYGGDLANDPSYTGAVMLRSYEAVARDIDHPSVILWSIGNENRLTTLHMASIRTVKGLDPTRPVLMPWHAEDWLPPEIDILAPHYNGAAQYDELAGRATRPVVSTEYTHAYGTDGFGGLEERWKALTKHPAGTGGAIWMWADQGLQVTQGKTSTLLLNPDGIDGIVSSFREPQRDYWEAKAVYAQTYPAIEKAAFVPGQADVRIPIQNDFDFTNLSDVKISWHLMEDEHELDHDVMTIAGQPHTQAWLDLRLNKIADIRRGATYYAWFSFARADGSEITRRSVELVPQAADNFPPARVAGALSVHTGKEVVVQAGDATFRFDPKTAQLTSAMSKGKRVLTGAQFTLWRPMNSTEQIIVNAEGGEKDLPDLNRYRTVVREWHVSQTAEEVRVEAVADHIVDPKNRFTVSYRYSVHADGNLAIHYSVQPQVQATWLPFVGLTIQTAPELTHLRWLGLGPLDAYPNENVATILGVWSGTLGSGDATGMKATRWAELTEASGSGLRINGAPYIRVAGPSGIQALSSVAGRPSKRVRAEDPEQRLDTHKDASFEGQFSISFVDKSLAGHP